MSLIFRTDLKSGGKRLINLLHISFFDLKSNTIVFHHAYNRNPILGSLFFIGGGDNSKEKITYSSEKEAEKEFNEIRKTLEDYYTKYNK